MDYTVTDYTSARITGFTVILSIDNFIVIILRLILYNFVVY